MLEGRVEVDVVGDLKRQVQGRLVDAHARPVVLARTAERVRPRPRALRHERIEGAGAKELAERREVDDLVARAPTHPWLGPRDREDAETGHAATLHLPAGRAPHSGSV